MKKADLAYAAGIIDGEGCITITPQHYQKRPNISFTLRVVMGNTNEGVCQWFKFVFGGHYNFLHKTKGGKPFWQWGVSSQKAMEFLRLIIPYLKIKRSQAELAIKFQLAKKQQGGHKPEEEWLIEKAQQMLMQGMNK
jgi:hypothetical protein